MLEHNGAELPSYFFDTRFQRLHVIACAITQQTHRLHVEVRALINFGTAKVNMLGHVTHDFKEGLDFSSAVLRSH